MVDDLKVFLQAASPLQLCLGVAVVIVASGLPLLAVVIVAEPVLILATMLARQGHISLGLLLAVGAAASVAGDALSYLLGRLWQRKRRSRKHLPMLQRPLTRAGDTMRNHGTAAVIIQRWFPPGRGFVPALAGAAQMPFRRFLVFAAVAAVLWAGLNVMLAYFGGPQIMLLVPLLATSLVLVRFIRRRIRRKRGATTPGA